MGKCKGETVMYDYPKMRKRLRKKLATHQEYGPGKKEHCIMALDELLQIIEPEIEPLVEALELWNENFERDLISKNFLGDDDHKAHKKSEQVLRYIK